MSRQARLVVLPLVAAIAGLAVGAVVLLVVLVFARTMPSSDGWRDLGLIVVGMFLAAAVSAIVWVAGLARAARRLFGAGERLGALIAAVLAVFVLVLVSLAAGRTLEVPVVWFLVPALLVVPSVVFSLWDRRAAVSP